MTKIKTFNYSIIKKDRDILILLISILILYIARFYFISNSMVIDDEANYFIWSKHLSSGYVDHPPLIAYILRIFTFFFGEDGFGIRISGLLFYLFLSYLLYLWGKEIKDGFTGVLLIIIFNLIPLFYFTSFIITPDTFMIFFLFLTIYLYYKGLFKEKKYLYLGGISLGLGLLSKISTFWIALALFFYIFISKERKNFIKKKEIYISFLIAIVLFLPYIIWNIKNDFAFIRYQGARLMHRGNLDDFLILWIAQLGLLFPFFFILFIKEVLGRMIKYFRNIGEERDFFFAFTSFLPLVYIIGQSIYSRMEANWPAFIYMGGIFLIALYLRDNWERRFIRVVTKLSLYLIVIFIVGIKTHLFYPFLPLGKKDITNRYFYYQTLLDEFSDYFEKEKTIKEKRIFSTNYQIPSMINLYLKPKIEAICIPINYHPTFYDFIYPDKNLIGEDFYFLKRGENFPKKIKSYFKEITKIRSFNSYRRERIVAKFSLWYCKRYKGR